MRTIRRIEDIRSLDELIPDEEREIIKNLEQNTDLLCPYLKKDGDYFYYCSFGLSSEADESKEKKYARHLSVLELQLFCMSNYKNCVFFKKNY